MSSLHTEFRPQTFDEVLGQTAVVRSLKRAVKDKRAHAFLFVGPAGTGKTTLARIAARELTGGGTHNVYEYDAVSKSGADDMRALVAQLAYRSIGDSPVKFVIIDEAHRLSPTAWDVLLKPTEEPSPHVYFAFCTTVLGKIPKAIITRCLRYDLKGVGEEDIGALLIRVVDDKKLGISDEIIEAIVDESAGSPRQALVFLETCVGAKSVQEARSLIRSAGQQKEVIDLARWLVGGKGLNWKDACKLVKGIEGTEPETIRILLTNYFAAVLVNTQKDDVARRLLMLIECFSKPYLQSDKLAPLLSSLGMAIGLDE